MLSLCGRWMGWCIGGGGGGVVWFFVPWGIIMEGVSSAVCGGGGGGGGGEFPLLVQAAPEIEILCSGFGNTVLAMSWIYSLCSQDNYATGHYLKKLV